MTKAELRERMIGLYRDALPAAGSGTLEDRRNGYESMLAALPLNETATVVEDDANGRIRGFWVDGTHEESPRRTGLLLHGGGYVLGSARGYLSLASQIAVAARAMIYVAEYPLAPEHPFPAALNEVRDVWSVVASRGPENFLIGDSAGGGLALALACLLRDEGGRLPAGISLISPLTDLRATARTYETNAEADPICSRRGIQRAAEWYLSGADPATVPLGSPVLGNLAGLPPLLVHVGTDEVLLDDSTSLAAMVARAGGSITLRVSQDMVHVWPLFWSFLPEAARAIDEIARFFDETADRTDGLASGADRA